MEGRVNRVYHVREILAEVLADIVNRYYSNVLIEDAFEYLGNIQTRLN